MLDENKEKWGDKVRIIGVSLDDNVESVRNRVNEKKWLSVEHYQIEGGWNRDHNAL